MAPVEVSDIDRGRAAHVLSDIWHTTRVDRYYGSRYDGSYRSTSQKDRRRYSKRERFFLRVPPETPTAKAAVEWSFGIEAGQLEEFAGQT